MSGKYVISNEGAEKMTYSMNGHETEIDFVLVGKNNRKYFVDMKAKPLQGFHL